ncbi:MAG TPA: dihydrofolate reductase family protein [Gaiellaceae bacterium]
MTQPGSCAVSASRASSRGCGRGPRRGELQGVQGDRAHVHVPRRVRRRPGRRGRRGVRLVLRGRRRGSDASTTSDFTFRVSAASADHLRNLMAEVGAMLTGRRTFERADGWGGRHPWEVPAFVVTHRVPDGWPRADSTLHFVTDGLESAVARAKEAAGPRSVGVHGARTIQQLLNLGLLDEIHVDLAAVLMGAGVRLFDNLASAPVVLRGPDGRRRRRGHASALSRSPAVDRSGRV